MIEYSAIILKYLAFSPNYTPGVTWRLCAIVNFNSVDLLTRQRNRGDVSSSPEQQQLAVQQDSYMQSRAEAIQNLESTTNELSQIFRQLATMVSQQGEVAIRLYLSNILLSKFMRKKTYFFPAIHMKHMLVTLGTHSIVRYFHCLKWKLCEIHA
jgi:hypothetical protein